MYEYLDGRLENRQPTRIVVDVQGVGFSVAVPLGSAFRPAPRSDAQICRVWTHLVVRDDAHELYGFADEATRELFRLLLSVRGIGPGMALGILSHLEGDRLLTAIASGDTTPFLAVKGVGKKTAQQILLDLKDKAPRHTQEIEHDVLVPAGGTQLTEDAVRALVSIGYSDKEARKSVERATRSIGSSTGDASDLEALVRTALRQ